MRQRCAQDKPARLNGDDLGHVAVPVERGEVSDDAAERHAVLEQRRDVIEQNPGVAEIRNLTNELFVIHVGGEYRGTEEGVSISRQNCEALCVPGRRFPGYGHVGHLRERRPAAKTRQQFLDLRARTFDLDLHSSIIEIAHPAGQTQFLRGPLRERPIPNALDIA